MLRTAIASTIGTTLVLLTSLPAAATGADKTVSLVSSTQPAGTLNESLRREVDAAIDRSLNWLATKQKPDGSWSNGDFPALTGLPLWAFARAQHPKRDAVIDKAVAFIRSRAHENGAIFKNVEGRKGGGLVNYNTAICMTALHATSRPDVTRIVQKARTYISKAQYLGDDDYRGGFGYDAATKRAYTDLLNTYYSVQAMRLTQDVEDLRPAGEPRADIDWSETVKFISRMQNTPETGDDAGGMIYNPTDPRVGTATNAAGEIYFRSYGSITYAGLLSMVFANMDREDVRVRSALDWAQRHWTLDENPGMGQEGLFFFYSILTRALSALDYGVIETTDGEQLNWAEAVASRLLTLQRIDADGNGYWLNQTGRYWESDPVLVTAYALLALEAL